MRILILGSGPNVVAARTWSRAAFDHILVINNAWSVRTDWDELIHPEDFPHDRRPLDRAPSQKITTAADYVPAQNDYGGFVYAGGTMAFTAGYWALWEYRPKALYFMGCDMVYPDSAQTHFYGKGQADPLRDDITLQSLEAKSARLLAIAWARESCAVINLSQDDSRLIFPRGTMGGDMTPPMPAIDAAKYDAALAREAQLGYFVPSGRYWEDPAQFDANALADLDAMWLDVPAR